MMTDVYEAKSHELEEIQKFYELESYRFGAIYQDRFVIARQNQKIIGIVKLCLEEKILVLRGMRVTKAYQKKGIGRNLLKLINKIIGTEKCYCLPYNYLEEFYGKIGFKKIDPELAPPHLLKRLKEYHKTHPEIIMMKKEGTSLIKQSFSSFQALQE